MKPYLFFFGILLSSTSALSQMPDLSDWVGHYEGTFHLEYPNGKHDSLKIHFDFDQIDSSHWSHKISYFSEKYGNMVKNYFLVWNDTLSSSNRFVLDEDNGILIDEVLLNNTFYAQYNVAESNFQTILRKKEYGLYFEIIVSSPEKGINSTSRNEEGKLDETFNVNSSLVYTIQYAYLHK